jgi:hypothetical protein
MTNLTRGAGGGGKLARIDGAKIFALIEKRSAICVDESDPDVSQEPIPRGRQQSATPICSRILYLRKSVNAPKISAEKRIAYMLLDSIAGRPAIWGAYMTSMINGHLQTEWNGDSAVRWQIIGVTNIAAQARVPQQIRNASLQA